MKYGTGKKGFGGHGGNDGGVDFNDHGDCGGSGNFGNHNLSVWNNPMPQIDYSKLPQKKSAVVPVVVGALAALAGFMVGRSMR